MNRLSRLRLRKITVFDVEELIQDSSRKELILDLPGVTAVITNASKEFYNYCVHRFGLYDWAVSYVFALSNKPDKLSGSKLLARSGARPQDITVISNTEESRLFAQRCNFNFKNYERI